MWNQYLKLVHVEYAHFHPSKNDEVDEQRTFIASTPKYLSRLIHGFTRLLYPVSF